LIARVIATAFNVLLMLLLLLALGLVWLLGTTSGARFATAAAEDLLPALELRVSGGSFWRGLSVTDLRWRQPGVQVTAERAAFRWQPECLLRGTVCIERLEIGAPRVTVDTSALPPPAGPPAPEADTGERIDLPVALDLEALEIEQARVVVDGREAAFERLRTGVAAAGDQVTLAPTVLRGLRVTLPEPEPEPEPEPPRQPGGFALPEVSLPLDVAIERFELVDARLRRGELDQSLERLVLEATLEGQTLELDRLLVRRADGELRLEGELTLAGDWPLAFEFDVLGRELPEIGEQRLTGSLTGSARDLHLEANARGAIALTLSADVRPLDEALPWSLTLNGNRLRWPLSGEQPRIRVDQLALEASGQGMDFEARLDTRIAGADIPEGHWRLRVSGDPEAITVEQLAGETLAGTLEAQGRVALGETIRWQAEAQAQGLELERYLPELQPRLGGRVEASGTVAGGQWSLALRIPGIEGSLAGYPLTLSGEIARTTADAWTVDDLQLATGPNRVRIDGSLDEQWDAVAQLDLPELGALWPGLAGAVAGGLQVTGPRLSPTVEADLQGERLVFKDNRVRRVQIEARVSDAFQAPSQIRLVADGIATAAQRIGDLELTLQGTRVDHALELTLAGEPVSADLALGGSLQTDSLDWSGQLTRARLDLPAGAWTLADVAELAWNQANQRARIGPHCWRQEDTSLCLPEPLLAGPAYARGSLVLSDYELSRLEPWLPPGLGIRAQVDARASVAWDGGPRPRLDVVVESRGGTVTRDDVDAEQPVELHYDELVLSAQLDRELATVRLELASDALGQGRLVAQVDPFSPARELSGEVALEGLRLAAALPFIPALRDLEGRISARGELGGVLTSPRFDGQIRLTDGLVVAREVPTAVENIQLVARIQGQSAVLEGGFRMGGGEAVVGGSIDWADGLSGVVALNGDRLRVAYPPYAKVAVSPALSFTLSPQQLAVTGRIGVPWGRISIESLPPSTVKVSSDVVVVTDDTEPEAPSTPADGGGFAITSNVYVVLGDDVEFTGFGVEGRLAGSLQLRQTGPAGVEAAGEIRLEEGVFEAYGQELTITRGQLLFAGPISEPRLDVEAVRVVGDVTAGLRVTGPASQPEVELFSQPPLPEGTILAYIITGSAPGGATPSEEALVAQAALSAGVFGGAGIGSALADQLGIEDFSLETEGSGEDTQVAVSGYITPNLLLRYGVGVFQPENTLTLRYYLTRNLYLEAVSGFESALDIFYSFDF
jgi:translocation and assembly module TamB